MREWIIPITLLVLVCGCGGGEQETSGGEEATQPPSQVEEGGDTGDIFRGHLVYGNEQQLFKACGTNRTTWVVDLTLGEMSRVYKQLVTNPLDPIFVEVRGQMEPPPTEGFGAAYDQQLTVLQVRRASLEGAGCNEDPLRTNEFRARGNEPFWSVEISENGIEFSDFGRSQRLVFPYVSPNVSPPQRQYVSTNQGHRIEVTIDERACTDSMSGAYFSFVARVKVDGRTYSGCAMEGWQ